MYENQFQHEGQVGRRGRRGNVRANSTVTRVLAAQRWLSPKDWPVLGFFFQGLTSVFFFLTTSPSDASSLTSCRRIAQSSSASTTEPDYDYVGPGCCIHLRPRKRFLAGARDTCPPA
jgi:hypothetical protein